MSNFVCVAIQNDRPQFISQFCFPNPGDAGGGFRPVGDSGGETGPTMSPGKWLV